MDDASPLGNWALDVSGQQELAANAAKAAMIAQHAIWQKIGETELPETLNFDPMKPLSALLENMFATAAQPERFFKAQADFAQSAMAAWQASFAAATATTTNSKDKRFLGAAWRHPFYDALSRIHQAQSEWIKTVSRHATFGDAKAGRRVQLFSSVIADLFSPANFLASNPEAIEEAVRTRGASLVRGMESFAADLERGSGLLTISQTDMSQFQVGENIAVTPGKVIFQNELFQLIQFSPATESVREIPILIATSIINKYYILDLTPRNSMVRWLTEQGFTVFVTSWVNPDSRQADKTFENYMVEGLATAVSKVLVQTGASKLNITGYCISGTLLSCALAFFKARGMDNLINSATFFAAQQDFTDAGDLALFVGEDTLPQLERRMDKAGGVLPGNALSEAFNLLRANDLIFSFVVNNYLMGRKPKAFDLLFWNADQTRLPKALGLWYLRNFYQDNMLAKGELELGGERLDLSKVTTPIFVQAGKEDHIAPAASVYRGARLFGGPVTFTLAGSGHIAGVVNHPAAAKYKYWSNSNLPETLEAWREDALETAGSWWPAWAAWLHEYSGKMIPAPDFAEGPLSPIEDAPGSYVKVMI